jgi:hypothetical protein
MIELEKLTTDDIPVILQENISFSEAHLTGLRYPITQESLERLLGEIDIQSHIYKLIVDGTWVAFFSIWNRSYKGFDNHVKVADTYVFPTYRNKSYNGKPYIYWIAVESVKIAKQVYPDKDVVGIMSDYDGVHPKLQEKYGIDSRYTIKAPGVSSVLAAGWKLAKRQNTGENQHIGNIYFMTYKNT